MKTPNTKFDPFSYVQKLKDRYVKELGMSETNALFAAKEEVLKWIRETK